MGVNMNIQIVRGYYLTESQVKSANLSDEDIDEIMDHPNVHHVSSMTNGDIIVGKLLLESPDGRYDPMDIPLTSITGLIRKSENENPYMFEHVPEKLKELILRVKPGCDYHLYTYYH